VGAFGENRGVEGQVAYATRKKSGLETPLRGRFYGENKLLMFAPPLWYDMLVGLCIIGGAIAAIHYLRNQGESYEIFTPLAVMVAGVWGAASSERMIIDLRSRSYARFEGQALRKHVTRGMLAELDAMVLTSEQYPHGTGLAAHVVYRLIIYWKGMRQPLLVAEREDRNIPFGAPLNHGAASILQRGARYAAAIGVPYYDNSHMAGKAPVRTI
jgi:hypothetical protein